MLPKSKPLGPDALYAGTIKQKPEMPDFDPQRPQATREPNRLNRLRSVLTANWLRTAWIGLGVLFFVMVVIPGALLIYRSSGIGDQQQANQQQANQQQANQQQANQQQANQQQEAQQEENGKITFGRLTSDTGSTIYEMNADGTGVTKVTDPSLDILSPAISPTGEKIAFVTNPPNDLYVMNADGTDLTHIFHQQGPLGLEGGPVFSPDGKRIAFLMYPPAGAGTEIYVMNADGTDLTRLTKMEGDESGLVWSPNGTKISFVNTRSESEEATAIASAQISTTSQAYEMNADGTALKKISSTPRPGVEGVPSSPDCKKIAFLRDNDIYVRNPDGQEVQITDDANVYVDPVLSPDCKWIAFTADRTLDKPGQELNTYREIYVIDADGTDLTRLTKGHTDYVLGWRSG
jgi:Tol biopolymer transport system component